MIFAGIMRGPWAVLMAWAVGHGLWSVTFARNVERWTLPRV
jgi:hypothetical protein